MISQIENDQPACDVFVNRSVPRMFSIFSTCARLEYGFTRKHVRASGFSASHSGLPDPDVARSISRSCVS